MGLIIDMFLVFTLNVLIRIPFIWGAATLVLNDSNKGRAVILAFLGSLCGFLWSLIPLLGALWPIVVLAADYSYFKRIYDASALTAFAAVIMVGIIEAGLLFALLLLGAPFIASVL